MKSKRIYIYLVAAAASMSGCATHDAGSSTVASTTAGADQQKVITEQKSQINNLEAMLKNRDKELQQKDADLKASSAVKGTSAVDGLFPPNAKAGHCYARILIPASWGETTETVLTREASERVEIIPARYETVNERVMTKEASSRLETIPARYESTQERVMVRPESKRIEEIPATYKTTTEQIMISPARTEWKRGPASSFGNSVVQSRTTDTGEVMCLVETPARYQTVSKKVVDRPAGIREVVIPAEYKTIKKTVLVEAAKTREISIPAEYSNIKVEKLKAAASERRIAIPAEHGKVTKRTLVSEDQLQWREVLCQVNMTGENIRALQTTLQKSGYDVGPIDGVLGSKTLSSANSYAKSNGLPYGSNYIAIEVAKKLGLKI